MPKTMLIDAAHAEETRVVVVDGNRVEEFDFESQNRKQLRGNIYLAKVTRVEPSLQAAFVEYGGNRHGFLAFSDIHPDYYAIPHDDQEAIKAELAKAVKEGGTGLTETALQKRVVDAVRAKGCEFDTLPIVGFGPNAADPHYEPVAGKDATLGKDTVILLDLWAGKTKDTVFADQTWMGFSGKDVPAKVMEVWTVVRDARDAAIRKVQETVKAGKPLSGYEVDRASRDHIEGQGYGKWFVHRTGHSIDRDLHGSGPHMDDYETHDERRLIPGVGFSVEPGVYLTGEFGVRSEINMFWGPGGPEVTPVAPQRDLIIA